MRVWPWLLLLVIGACGGTAPPAGDDDGPPGNEDGPPGTDGGNNLVPGSLAVTWMHGSQNCAQNADPEVQVHAYNANTHIIRQNKCDTFEAPFIYVLAGTQSALVFDTGATNTTTLRTTVRSLIGSVPLLVAHTHAHGDHVAGDSTFSGQPMTTVVGTSQAAVQTAFGIASWPTDLGTHDLGGRVLDVLAIPGHQATHIAIYDRQTGLLLTGDSVYPGHLFIGNWTDYRASVSRLAQFVASHPIAHVLGAHIEMTSTAKLAYPYGTVFQPDEHVLQLTAANVMELDAAVTAAGAATPSQDIVLDHFIVEP